MYISRRNFIRGAALTTASLWVPRFLQAEASRASIRFNGKILVMLQLSGGNDGLNTVIPTLNDIYYRERPRLAINQSESLRLNDELRLHPSLTALKNFYDNGDLALLNNVGYPNPDRSHFRSMDIWQTASGSSEYWNTGWLGRFIDAQCDGQCKVPAVEVDDMMSLALKSKKSSALALQHPDQLYRSAHSPWFDDLVKTNHSTDQEAPVDYLYKTMADAMSGAAYIYEKNKVKKNTLSFPDTSLGKKMETIADLILADTETPVYYVSLGSFDTHVNQQMQQKRLFDELSGALDSFRRTLEINGRWDDVMVVTFSEFGRRVAQNASGGTDHGAASQMFFMGGNLPAKGILNEAPDLEDLEDGDLKYKVDFRSCYASILEQWLDTRHEGILKEKFDLVF